MANPSSSSAGGAPAGRGWGWALGLVGASALVVLAVVVVNLGDEEEPSGRVAVVGDSVTYLAADALRESFSWSPGFNVQARPGWRTDELVPVAEDLVADGPEVLVLLTGYNDVRQQADPEPGLERMVEVAARVGCTVWMLLPVKGDYDRARAEAYDDRLRQLTEPVSSIHLSSAWLDAVDGTEGPDPDPELVSEDRVHPSGAGRRTLARLMEDAVRRLCPPGGP